MLAQTISLTDLYQPHEDGLAYFPSVATLSLGSYTIMHYYQYLHGESPSDSSSAGGGAIDTKPVLTIFLEPRSLVITRSQLYTHHLHGIDGITRDVIVPAQLGDDSNTSVEEYGTNITADRIANRHLVKREPFKMTVGEGGDLNRRKRISLTFRDVEKVFKPRFR